MKDFFNKHYYIHLIVGIIISLVLLTTFVGVPTYMQIIFTAFISVIVAVAWEWFWRMYNKSEIDYCDVYWTLFGSMLTLLIAIIL